MLSPATVSLSTRPPSLFPIPSTSSSYPNFPSAAFRRLKISNKQSETIPLSPQPTRRKGKSRRDGGVGETSEAADLVRSLLRKTAEGNQPLIPTLNKHVRVIRTEHCFLMFEELGKKDRWLQCLEVFRWMQKQRWYVADNGIYSKLISVMGKRGQTRTATWLFSEMRSSGCRPDTSVYNSLISAHLRHRDRTKALAKAWAYLDKMKASDRCRPNTVTYNILLRACAQAGDTDRVDSLFQELDQLGGSDSCTFNGVMDAYGKSGRISDMEAILRRMKAARCKPDAITFNLLIDAYGKNRALDKMEQVFQSLLKSKVHKPTHATFHSMILAYGRARDISKVDWAAETMDGLGYRPSMITKESLIAAYGLCGEVGRAREVFEGMLRAGPRPEGSTLNVMLEAYCGNGLEEEAGRVADLHAGLANAATYRLLYRAYARAGQKDLILGLLKAMDRAGIVPNKAFFLDALGAYSQSEQAKETMD